MKPSPSLTLAGLAHRASLPAAPFYLALSTGESLLIKRVFRFLPGRRLTALARRQDTPVVAKVFFRPGHWRRHLRREMQGIAALQSAAVPTPTVLQSIDGANGGAFLLEYLDGGRTLLDIAGGQTSKTTDGRERVHAVRQAASLIGRCHRNGLWQQDAHLDNFMLHDGRLYLLDGAAVRRSAIRLKILFRFKARRNLALFFAQFPAFMDEVDSSSLSDLLAVYQAESGMGFLHASFQKHVDAARRRRLRRYERKLFRSTSAHRAIRRRDGFLVYRRDLDSPGLHELAENPDRAINEGRILKRGNTSTVAEVTLDGAAYVLKRYNIKNFRHGLRLLLRPSRARRSWRNGLLLGMLGIATPRPCLMLEQRRLWLLRRRAYLLCEKVEGPTLESLIHENKASAAIDTALQQLKKVLAIFERHRISHGDMKASNFILSPDGGLHLLDLDAMTHHRTRHRHRRLLQKDHHRLLKNFNGSTHLPALPSQEIFDAGKG